MPTNIHINNITGATPFNIYLCYPSNTSCIYINTIPSSSLPYDFLVPSILEGELSYSLKVIDNNDCVFYQNVVIGPPPAPTNTPTNTPTQTPGASPSQTPTQTTTQTPTQTPGASPSQTPTQTTTQTPTQTPGASPSQTPTMTQTQTSTPTQTPTPTKTQTPTPTPTTSTTSNPCPNCVEGSQVVIGTQRWAVCNLSVDTFSDGTPIPPGGWRHYDDNPANDAIYGKLYSFSVVQGIWDEESAADPDYRLKLAPEGYHIPTQAEWNTLYWGLGGENVAGSKLKEIGFCHWEPTNTDGNNETGFTALGGGYLSVDYPNEQFAGLKQSANFWSSTIQTEDTAWYYFLNSSGPYNGTYFIGTQNFLSVRCIKEVYTHYLDRSSSYCVFNFCLLNDPVTAFIAYSLDSVLVEGSYIYADELLTIPYTAGPLIDNDTYIFNVSSIGQLSITCTKGLAC